MSVNAEDVFIKTIKGRRTSADDPKKIIDKKLQSATWCNANIKGDIRTGYYFNFEFYRIGEIISEEEIEEIKKYYSDLGYTLSHRSSNQDDLGHVLTLMLHIPREYIETGVSVVHRYIHIDEK